jgi:hypothetical protein
MELKLGFSNFGHHGMPGPDEVGRKVDTPGDRTDVPLDLTDLSVWLDYLTSLRTAGVTAEDLLLCAHVPTKVSALWFTGNFAPVPTERRRVRDAVDVYLAARKA